MDWRALEAKVVECLRLEHYSYRTEQTYVAWIRRFVEFHGWRKPSQLGAADVKAFLKRLALDMQAASSTQNQALNAVVFLYKKAIGKGDKDRYVPLPAKYAADLRRWLERRRLLYEEDKAKNMHEYSVSISTLQFLCVS